MPSNWKEPVRSRNQNIPPCRNLQNEVANLTRVCTYNPAGTLWSDPGPALTCGGRVREIHTALHSAGIEGALVVVGHSVGNAFARLYAANYPEQVRGMVLIDHAGRYRVKAHLRNPRLRNST